MFTKGKQVNKSQLIDTLATRFEGNRKQAAQALEAVIDTITREVAKGEKVAITGFGSFEKRVRDARWVRNPRTGERIKAKKTAIPKFSAGADLKAVVSGAKKLPKLTVTAATDRARGATGRTATKATTKSAPAKKTAAKSTARKAPASRSTAKKAPATKSTAKKAPAKKAPAKKAPAKTAAKSTARKTPATKSTAKRTTTARKAPAKKTTTAKRTTKKA
jgi:DNA-binding protein HU-beta